MLPQLAHKALIIQDVKDAVAAGKIVTISQSMISDKGWTGAGYILIDPNTGAGAYLIGGGQDGAFINILEQVLDGIPKVSPFALIGLGAIFVGLAFYAPMTGELKAALLAIGVGLAAIGTSYLIEQSENSNLLCTLGLGSLLGGLLTFMRAAKFFGSPVGDFGPRVRMWISGVATGTALRFVICPK